MYIVHVKNLWIQIDGVQCNAESFMVHTTNWILFHWMTIWMKKREKNGQKKGKNMLYVYVCIDLQKVSINVLYVYNKINKVEYCKRTIQKVSKKVHGGNAFAHYG